MNQKFTVRLSGLASVLVLLSGISANVAAQQPYYPAQLGATVPYQMPSQPYNPAQPGATAPYQMPSQPYNPAQPRAAAPSQMPSRPYYPAQPGAAAPSQLPSRPYPMRTAPMPPRHSYNYPSAPYGSRTPMNRPPVYNSPRQASPYGNRPMNGNPRFGGAPNRGFNRGSRSPIPFESNFTPWSTRFWDEMGEGGENPFKDIEDWVDFKEPREGIANAWEDMINAPHEVGQMPGGWTAPSISVPNPVDVQKEFQETGKRVPDEMRTQMDNIEIQTW